MSKAAFFFLAQAKCYPNSSLDSPASRQPIPNNHEARACYGRFFHRQPCLHTSLSFEAKLRAGGPFGLALTRPVPVFGNMTLLFFLVWKQSALQVSHLARSAPVLRNCKGSSQTLNFSISRAESSFAAELEKSRFELGFMLECQWIGCVLLSDMRPWHGWL